MSSQPVSPSEQVFVLDIGTRSIIGIVGRKKEQLFHPEAFAMAEHPRRAMIDGQIEDIPQVARVAGQVKAELEQKLGISLTKVGVAAAGRALKTCRGTHSVSLPPGPVTARTVFDLENGAVNHARSQLDTGSETAQYTCVGHSVVKYQLDGYPFLTILDHRGSQTSAEVIATFLPTEVVNSLRRCMEMLSLEIETLTLEPIAAMRAVIPADIRLLNLALVDVGAGTSDIAITNDGTVAGYTMATMAGDEITEALIKRHLVDFPTAESIKIALSTQDKVEFTDILGFEHTLPTSQILEELDLPIEMLAKIISDKILECNQTPPAAVFLAGGGSKTPGLAAKVAEKLGLEPNKVALAGSNFTGRLLTPETTLSGPEFATPLGIALTTLDEAETQGTSVLVNSKRVRLFTSQTTSIMDALLTAGYVYSDLMGRNGRSLSFVLNGTNKVVRGSHYTVAQISLNGAPATLNTPVSPGDSIEILPATPGQDAAAVVADFFEDVSPFTVSLNGQPKTAGILAFLNGVPTSPYNPISPGDELELVQVNTVGDLCRLEGLSPDEYPLQKNGAPCTPDSPLEPQDDIQAPGAVLSPSVNQAAPLPASGAPPVSLPENQPKIPTLTNLSPGTNASPLADAPRTQAPPASLPTGKPAAVPPLQNTAQTSPKAGAQSQPPPLEQGSQFPQGANNQMASPSAEPAEPPEPPALSGSGSLCIHLNGRRLVLPPKPGGDAHHMLDMLPLLDIDPAHPKGVLVLKKNNQDAAYLDQLSNQDKVEIGWDNSFLP